eukprot:gene29779-37140_t
MPIPYDEHDARMFNVNLIWKRALYIYGWAVGDDGVICWSSDYGRSWLYTQVTEGSGAALSGVVSLGEEDAMVV